MGIGGLGVGDNDEEDDKLLLESRWELTLSSGIISGVVCFLVMNK